MSDDGERATSAVIWQELGTLEVADQVFRDLALRASQDVPGVASVGRARGLFRRRWAAEGVQVERGGGEVAFSIHLSVRYEVCIPDMVDELRKRLTEVVEATTGHKVRTINVTVEHILPPEAGEARPKPSGGPPALPKAPEGTETD
ncbi:MAG: Asp23/Gls24 family envelope stress response protein [Planctomycetes bacterium]|nr:Asp23/Gls24 family envelope stress response protein [Planctomycetota bacterium]